MQETRRASRNAVAAGVMMLGMALICVNDGIIKHVSPHTSVGQILLLRGAMICLIAVAYLSLTGKELIPKQMLQKWNVIRSLCEMVATAFFVTCLSLLPLATASTLIWTSPMVLTILAALVLRERVNAGRWIAVLVGFVGVCLVTRPGTDTWVWAMLLPLAAAAIGAYRDLITRYIGSGLSSMHIALSAAVLTTSAGGVLSIAQWQPLHFATIGWLAASAAVFASGYTCFVVAIRSGDLSFVAPFSYASIIFAIVLGFVVWQEVPSVLSLLGAAVIIIVGVVIFYWEGRQSSGAEC